tara:strand:+ start:375 stop:866 length:492 start_codon:yes stop_codon:yes gene_type:complete
MNKGFKVWDDEMLTDVSKYPEGERLPDNYLTGKIVNGKLAWRPVVIGDNPSYDSDIQTKTFERVINDDNVTINFIVVDKDLEEIKERKKQKTKWKGKEIVLAKRSEEYQRNAALGLLSEQETEDIKTDIETIRKYYHEVFKPSLNACTTVHEVKNLLMEFPII